MRDVIGRFSGTTLAGRRRTLPDDLARPTLLAFAYRQRQQPDVESWLAVVQGDEVDVLEVPLLGRRWMPARRFINGGMAANMDLPTREQTMCVYTDVGAFRRDVLGVRSRKVLACLVHPGGEVAWHALGPSDDTAAADLRSHLSQG